MRLRRRVDQLLEEVRRLNWLAVDADRGFRAREEAIAEMDAIEARLREIIAEIRKAAGEISPEAASDTPPPLGSERAG
jgi:hypothetical protein